MWKVCGRWLGRWNRKRGRRDGRGGDGYRFNQWGDNIENIALGTEPNAPLAYDPGLEHHQPIMSTFGEPGGRLERERDEQ